MGMIPFPAVALALGLLVACGGSGAGGDTDPGQPPPTNTLSGTVTRQGNGQPVAGARVTVLTTNSSQIFTTTTTDAQGAYRVSGLCATSDVPAEYLVWAQAPGLAFYPSTGAPGRVARFSQNQDLVLGPGEGAMLGLDATMIDFVSTVAGGSLTGADFSAYDGTDPRIQLPRTGQTASWAAGDDGGSQLGVAWPANRFTDNQDGTVTDHLTGLVWLQDAGFTPPADWNGALAAVQQLASGQAGLADGSRAGDWRLPNLNELESLIDVSRSGPALPAGAPFTGVAQGNYWTSTPYYGGKGGSSQAWAIRMSDGRWINGDQSRMTAANGVWAVKGTGAQGVVHLPATGMWVICQAGDDGSVQSGVGLTSPRWIDNQDGTETDSMTGLVWLRQAGAIQGTWDQVLAQVAGLGAGTAGLADGSRPGDWRLPNRRELASMADRMQTNEADYFGFTFYANDGSVFQPAIFATSPAQAGFQPSAYYWTSSTDAADPTGATAWAVFSCDFGIYDWPKAAVGCGLAVRGPL